MQERIRYIPQHIDGHFITVRCERTTDYTTAVRFNHEADLHNFLNGQFGPEQPEKFSVVHLKITYELEVSEDESISENC